MGIDFFVVDAQDLLEEDFRVLIVIVLTARLEKAAEIEGVIDTGTFQRKSFLGGLHRSINIV